jgi:hypothetical protein
MELFEETFHSVLENAFTDMIDHNAVDGTDP